VSILRQSTVYADYFLKRREISCCGSPFLSWLGLRKNAPTEGRLSIFIYKLTGRNCSMFVRDVLHAAGIDIPVSIKPKNFIHDIHSGCANHAFACAP
jgi:hypothetical protein